MENGTVEALCEIIAAQNDIIRKQNDALEQLGAVCCEEEKAALDGLRKEVGL